MSKPLIIILETFKKLCNLSKSKIHIRLQINQWDISLIHKVPYKILKSIMFITPKQFY